MPFTMLVRTTRCVPDAAGVDNSSLIVAPVLVKFAPSPKKLVAVIDPKPTMSGTPEKPVLFPTISPPIWTLLPIPTPPRVTIEPVVTLVEFVSLWTLMLPVEATLISPVTSSLLLGLANLIFSLNVTGPSNWDNICFDVPPSTSSLSFTITSSATILNLFGSSPVTVGIGISNVVCWPLADAILVFPM